MIEGNFVRALSGLIHNLTQGGVSNEQMLAQWDQERGTDWWSSTLAHDQASELTMKKYLDFKYKDSKD